MRQPIQHRSTQDDPVCLARAILEKHGRNVGADQLEYDRNSFYLLSTSESLRIDHRGENVLWQFGDDLIEPTHSGAWKDELAALAAKLSVTRRVPT